MAFRNSHGRQVDPVPFLVVSLLGLLVSYSYGPLFLMAYGLTLATAMALATLASFAATVVAYYRLVWTYRPELTREVPVESRLRRLAYAAALFGLLLFALTLPLLT